MQNVQSLVISSSRKSYVAADEQLRSLENESPTEAQIECQAVPVALNCSLQKQLAFLHETRLKPLLPCHDGISDAIEGFMERLKDVRDSNKKFIQIKAFYDLLRYMKQQGIRTVTTTALNRDIQIAIIES